MELLYLWVDKRHTNIKGESFNLSNKYKFNFRYEGDDWRKGKLTVEEIKNPPPDNFFQLNHDENAATITNVTAIVGKNGSGKTTLLKILHSIHLKSFIYHKECKHILYTSSKPIDFIVDFKSPEYDRRYLQSYILVYDCNNEFNIDSFNKVKSPFGKNGKGSKEVFESNNFSTIFFSNILNHNTPIKNRQSLYNISTTYLIEEDGIGDHKRNERERQLAFFLDERSEGFIKSKSSLLKLSISEIEINKYWKEYKEKFSNEYQEENSQTNKIDGLLNIFLNSKFEFKKNRDYNNYSKLKLRRQQECYQKKIFFVKATLFHFCSLLRYKNAKLKREKLNDSFPNKIPNVLADEWGYHVQSTFLPKIHFQVLKDHFEDELQTHKISLEKLQESIKKLYEEQLSFLKESWDKHCPVSEKEKELSFLMERLLNNDNYLKLSLAQQQLKDLTNLFLIEVLKYNTESLTQQTKSFFDSLGLSFMNEYIGFHLKAIEDMFYRDNLTISSFETINFDLKKTSLKSIWEKREEYKKKLQEWLSITSKSSGCAYKHSSFPSIVNYTYFDWDSMSSGEYYWLNFFSRIYNILTKKIEPKYTNMLTDKKFTSYTDNVLLLLDEPNTGFHPQWQREYLECLLTFLPSLLPTRIDPDTNQEIRRNIQIILTTHSPFILSDLPKQNVIFLDKDKNGNCKVMTEEKTLSNMQTFGANIHSLLAHSFFLKDGLVGRFAKQKIDEIIAWLRQNKMAVIQEIIDKQNRFPDEKALKVYIKQIIAIIDEPIIQRKLNQMFCLWDEKFEKEQQIKQELDTIMLRHNIKEEELKKLLGNDKN